MTALHDTFAIASRCARTWNKLHDPCALWHRNSFKPKQRQSPLSWPQHACLASQKGRSRDLRRRRSLWAEHLGDCADPLYNDPASLECVRAIRAIADANWQAYVQKDVVPMRGHLMTWPYKVSDKRHLRATVVGVLTPVNSACLVGTAGLT